MIPININSERLWRHIFELGEIGKDPNGGITRLSFTEEERAAKDYVGSLMKEAGLQVYEDEVGNLIGKIEGQDASLPSVLLGSHIDSVFQGGNFDGPAGVLSAIEVVQSLKERNEVPMHPIEVVAFTDEEGARFSTGMLGSMGICGDLSLEELKSAKDKQNITLWDAMKQSGYNPEDIGKAARTPGSIKAYLELHIEQGKVLETAGLSVGVVKGIVGVAWLRFTLRGEAGHAGTTPMPLRKDPMVAAAIAIQEIEQIVKKREVTVATVGNVNVAPGGINIIPGTVQFTVDLRDISEGIRDEVEQEIRRLVETVCVERGIEVDMEELHKMKPVLCSPAVVEVIEASCKDAGLPTQQLVSGAGHDAMIMASITDVGMIFVKSKDGISHNPKEWTDQEDLANGAEVLYHAVRRLAGV